MAHKMAIVIFYKMVNILTILFYFILHRLASWPSGPSRYMMLPSHSIASQSDSVFKYTILTRSTGKFSTTGRQADILRLFFNLTVQAGSHRTGQRDRQGREAKYFNILTIWSRSNVSRANPSTRRLGTPRSLEVPGGS
jgi:hypothetical protein